MWEVASIMTAAALAADRMPAEVPPILLSATSKWQMDYAPSECRLVRSFGTGSGKITLQFGRMLIENYLEITIVGPNLQGPKNLGAVSVSTKAMENIPNMEMQSVERTDTGLDVIRFKSNGSISIALDRDIAAKVPTVMTVALSKDKRLNIGLGSMSGAMAALDKCMDDLMTTWGLSPAEQRARRSAPQPLNRPVDWFRPEDYPAFHGFFGEGALITIRLIGMSTAFDLARRWCATSLGVSVDDHIPAPIVTTGDGVDQLIRRLDLTSFPNSTGPRRASGKRTPEDYGFIETDRGKSGVTMTSRDGGWLMSFTVLATSVKGVDVCFRDQALQQRADRIRPSYDAVSSLRLTRGADGYWSALASPINYPSCRRPGEQR